MRTYILMIVGALVLILAGCAEKPKAIGDGLIDPNDIFTITDTTITAVFDTTYTAPINGGSSSNTLAGRISPTEELIALYNFNDAGAIDSLIGARIDTAELRLFVTYSMTPASPPITFKVHEVLQPWAQSSFTTDSMKSFSISAISYGNFSDSMNVSSDVKATLDTNLIRRWIHSKTDTGALPFYGFAVMADPGLPTGIIGFLPFGSFTTVDPRLVIKYTKNGASDSLILSSGEDTYAARFSVPPVLSQFEVRGAFGVRSKLSFTTPFKDEKPIVNNATLVLTVDSVQSIRSAYSPDSLIALLSMYDSTSLDESDETLFSIGTKKEDPLTGKTYTFNITAITQRWINSLNPNEGLSIRWAYETNTSDKVVFHSRFDPDSAKRPKLKITYSRK